MEISLDKKNAELSFLGNKWKFIACLLIIIPLTVFLGTTGYSLRSIMLVCFIPAAILIFLNFEAAVILFVSSFFLNYHYYYEAVSEGVAVLFILSYFISHKNIKNTTAVVFLPSFLVFIAAIFPSYVFTEAPIVWVLSLRLVLFYGIIFVVSQYVDSFALLKKILNIYLFWTVINGVHVVYRGITVGTRTFGFAGIMYVDYVGLGIAIAVVAFLYAEKHKLFYAFITVFLIAALIFTQTRNAWLSSGLLVSFLLIQFAIKSPEYGYNRKKVIALIITTIFILIAVVFILQAVAPAAFSRLSSSDAKTSSEIAEDLSSISSLATRFFIWKTAWNIFLANPLIGTGFYSFPFVSQHYSTLDPKLYEMFVEGLTPHLSFIAVVAESGLLGLIGFIIFLAGISRVAGRTVKMSKTKDQKFYSITMLALIIYSMISLTMTDAWLFGHGLMLWGLLLGLLNANYQIVKKQTGVSDL